MLATLANPEGLRSFAVKFILQSAVSGRTVALLMVGCSHARSMLQDVGDESLHAFFALNCASLDALEALRIGFFPEHFLFEWEH